MSSSHDPKPGPKAVVVAITVVAATYAYFLLFAQFGFLRALQLAANGEQEVIKHVFGLMGIAGISGSIFAASVFTPSRAPGTLMVGFCGCALAAGAVATGVPGKYFYLVSLVIGLGVGVVTVTLAGLLRAAAGTDRLGWAIGCGTGVAYAFCNLPMIFNAVPATQAWASLVIAAVGAVAASKLKGRAMGNESVGFDYSRRGIAVWTVAFFALVSLDSGAFYVIQNTPEIKGQTWTGEWRLEIIAIAHLGAAMFAGLAFDRGWMGRTIALAAMLLVMACALVCFFLRWAELGAWLYASAVSAYSVGLVFYASGSSRPSTAAVVYAIAGWAGSAVGIGLTASLHSLPAWFVAAAGVVMAAMLSLRWIFSRGPLPSGNRVIGKPPAFNR